MRRTALIATAPACLLLGLTPFAAQADPAPTGSATAAAAQVSSLVGVSSTGATADQNKSESRASVVDIGGAPVLGTGGTQNHEGESQGALLDSGAAAPVRVRVAPWSAASNGSAASSRRSSRASAAAARAEGPNGLKAGVLTSDAQAEHRNEQSAGTSTSNAVDLAFGDTTRLVLLHSEVGSTGKGHSFLVGLNGTEIGTREQLGQLCALDASVVSLSCLTASGGVANGITTGAAEVAGVKTALGLNPIDAFATTASYGSGTITPSVLPAVTAPAASSDVARAVAPAATAPAALPRTGVAIASLAAAALAALLSGAALRLLGLLGRRRPSAA